MTKHLPLTDDDDEIPELDDAWFARAKPAAEVLPASLLKKLGIRGKNKAPTKQAISVRLSPEVVDYFKEQGNGWQTRLDETLVNFVAKQKTKKSTAKKTTTKSPLAKNPPKKTVAAKKTKLSSRPTKKVNKKRTTHAA